MANSGSVELGTVISTFEGPSTNNFHFVINTNKVRKGQFIQTKTEDGLLFGVVTDITRANRYFERAESVAEYSRSAPIAENFPTTDWEYTIAAVKTLGIFHEEVLLRSTFPAAPGEKVFSADEGMLRKFLGFVDDGLNLGKLQNHNVEVKVKMNNLLQKHLSVLGISGSGKCLAYDEPILLANGEQAKIGEVVENIFKNATAISEEGGVQIASVSKNARVLSIGAELGVTSSEVFKATRRPLSGKMLRIKTRAGREISLTKEHPLLTLTKNGLEWKPAHEFNSGDFIATPRQLPFGERREVNLTNEFLNSDKICVCDKEQMQEFRSFARELAKKFNKNFRSLKQQIYGGVMPLKQFAEMARHIGRTDLLSKVKHLQYKGASHKIKPALVLDEPLGRFVGYLMGDGHVKNYFFGYTSITPELIRDYIQLTNKLFGLHVSNYGDEFRGHSKLVVTILSEIFGVKSNSKEKEITPFILEANKEFIKGFISALFDCDASVPKRKPEIEFCSASKKLADGVALLLSKFAIQTTCAPKLNKKYNREYYRVFLWGSDNLSIFTREIDFASEKKSRRLRIVNSGKPNTNVDVLPSSINDMLTELRSKLRVSRANMSAITGLSQTLFHRCEHGSRLSLNSFKKTVQAFWARHAELMRSCRAIEQLPIPSQTPVELLSSFAQIKRNKKLQYKEIAKHCNTTASTVRRMIVGQTDITDNLFEIGKGIAAIVSEEPHSLAEYASLTCDSYEDKLFQLADNLKLSYEQLDVYSCLYRDAWSSYKRREQKPSMESKIAMVCGLKHAAEHVKENLGYCREKLTFLSTLAESSIFWDKIVSLEEVGSLNEYVYDLTLKDNHNFLAGRIPIVVHNSYFMSCLIEELLDRKPEHGRIATVIIDIHGEYVGFGSGFYGDRTTVIEGKKIRIALHKLHQSTLSEFIPELTGSARREIEVILQDLKRESKEKQEPFDLADVIQRVNDSEIKENVKPVLLSHLHQLKALNLFGKGDNPSMKQLAQPGKLCVLDLSDVDNQKKKQLIVAYFARRLFKARKKGKIPPFVLLVEEAHNFAPERLSKSEALSKPIINTLSREGRKFGASLCLISQRPKYLSTTALSQCNSNIIFRITNPYDIEHIKESCESIDKSMGDAISTLRVGEAIILGEAVSHPIFVKIRQRKSKNPSKGESLESLARKFEQTEEQKSQDVEAFL